jgi:hypothetical protein
LLKIVSKHKKSLIHFCVKAEKHLIQPGQKDSQRYDQILEFLGNKGIGASIHLKEVLPMQAQREKITFNPRALNERY